MDCEEISPDFDICDVGGRNEKDLWQFESNGAGNSSGRTEIGGKTVH